jgi:nicotinate phosphoribosyltransferase
MVYKLVARQDAAGAWIGVAKASADKASFGGRKAAFRTLADGVATAETVVVSDGFEQLDTAEEHPDGRALQVALVDGGDIDTAHEGVEGTASARSHHLRVREELPVRALALSKSDPAIPTVYLEAD